MAESVAQFSNRIRSKFPGAYDDVEDRELVERFVAKFPVYKDAVDLRPKESPALEIAALFQRAQTDPEAAAKLRQMQEQETAKQEEEVQDPSALVNLGRLLRQE